MTAQLYTRIFNQDLHISFKETLSSEIILLHRLIISIVMSIVLSTYFCRFNVLILFFDLFCSEFHLSWTLYNHLYKGELDLKYKKQHLCPYVGDGALLVILGVASKQEAATRPVHWAERNGTNASLKKAVTFSGCAASSSSRGTLIKL